MNKKIHNINQEEKGSEKVLVESNEDFKFEKDSSNHIEKLDTNSSQINDPIPDKEKKMKKGQKRSIKIISERDIPLIEALPPNFSSKFHCWCHFRRTKYSQRVKLDVEKQE